MTTDELHGKARYYLVHLTNPDESFPCWGVHSVRCKRVPMKSGGDMPEWTNVVHSDHDGTKRGALAQARRLAERDGAPVLVEEDRSVERRKLAADAAKAAKP